eukprot:COSAG06_NODE_2067_length_7677_cov_2.824756_1_plen_83_part_10
MPTRKGRPGSPSLSPRTPGSSTASPQPAARSSAAPASPFERVRRATPAQMAATLQLQLSARKLAAAEADLRSLGGGSSPRSGG